MTEDGAALCKVLIGIREELAGIRAALELAVLPPAELPAQSEAPAECQHPEAAKVDFGGMGSDEEWECALNKGGCGFRYPRDLQLKVD